MPETDQITEIAPYVRTNFWVIIVSPVIIWYKSHTLSFKWNEREGDEIKRREREREKEKDKKKGSWAWV